MYHQIFVRPVTFSCVYSMFMSPIALSPPLHFSMSPPTLSPTHVPVFPSNPNPLYLRPICPCYLQLPSPSYESMSPSNLSFPHPTPSHLFPCLFRPSSPDVSMLFCLLDVHPCFLYPCPPYVSIFLLPPTPHVSMIPLRPPIIQDFSTPPPPICFHVPSDPPPHEPMSPPGIV
jgi:hypothetical protein